MTHWSESYVGKPFVEGKYMCAHLIRDVYQNEFRRNIDGIPVIACSVRGQSGQLLGNVSKRCVETKSPADGDLVLMRVARLWHVGLFCQIKGVDYVLHAVRSAKQVILTPIEKLRPVYRTTIESYWKVQC